MFKLDFEKTEEPEMKLEKERLVSKIGAAVLDDRTIREIFDEQGYDALSII